MKRLTPLQIQFIIKELENCKKNRKNKAKELANFFTRSYNSVLSYYYRYKYKKFLSLDLIINELQKDINNTPYIYSIKAEKGKIKQYRVRLNMVNFILRPKKRQKNVLQFPQVNNTKASEYDIQNVLSKLSDMVKNHNFNNNMCNTKLKIVNKELNKYRLNSCRDIVIKEKVLKQNILLRREIEKLKEEIRRLRAFNLDKKE